MDVFRQSVRDLTIFKGIGVYVGPFPSPLRTDIIDKLLTKGAHLFDAADDMGVEIVIVPPSAASHFLKPRKHQGVKLSDKTKGRSSNLGGGGGRAVVLRKGWAEACLAAGFDESPLVEKDNWGGFRYEEGYTSEDGRLEEERELEEPELATIKSKSKPAFPTVLAQMKSAPTRKSKGKERERERDVVVAPVATPTVKKRSRKKPSPSPLPATAPSPSEPSPSPPDIWVSLPLPTFIPPPLRPPILSKRMFASKSFRHPQIFYLEEFNEEDSRIVLDREDAIATLSARGATFGSLEEANVVLLNLEDDAVPTSDFQLEVLRSGKRALRLGWVVACLQARERVCDESWLVRLPTKETVEPVLPSKQTKQPVVLATVAPPPPPPKVVIKLVKRSSLTQSSSLENILNSRTNFSALPKLTFNFKKKIPLPSVAAIPSPAPVPSPLPPPPPPTIQLPPPGVLNSVIFSTSLSSSTRSELPLPLPTPTIQLPAPEVLADLVSVVVSSSTTSTEFVLAPPPIASSFQPSPAVSHHQYPNQHLSRLEPQRSYPSQSPPFPSSQHPGFLHHPPPPPPPPSFYHPPQDNHYNYHQYQQHHYQQKHHDDQRSPPQPTLKIKPPSRLQHPHPHQHPFKYYPSTRLCQPHPEFHPDPKVEKLSPSNLQPPPLPPPPPSSKSPVDASRPSDAYTAFMNSGFMANLAKTKVPTTPSDESSSGMNFEGESSETGSVRTGGGVCGEQAGCDGKGGESSRGSFTPSSEAGGVEDDDAARVEAEEYENWLLENPPRIELREVEVQVEDTEEDMDLEEEDEDGMDLEEAEETVVRADGLGVGEKEMQFGKPRQLLSSNLVPLGPRIRITPILAPHLRDLPRPISSLPSTLLHWSERKEDDQEAGRSDEDMDLEEDEEENGRTIAFSTSSNPIPNGPRPSKVPFDSRPPQTHSHPRPGPQFDNLGPPPPPPIEDAPPLPPPSRESIWAKVLQQHGGPRGSQVGVESGPSTVASLTTRRISANYERATPANYERALPSGPRPSLPTSPPGPPPSLQPSSLRGPTFDSIPAHPVQPPRLLGPTFKPNAQDGGPSSTPTSSSRRRSKSSSSSSNPLFSFDLDSLSTRSSIESTSQEGSDLGVSTTKTSTVPARPQTSHRGRTSSSRSTAASPQKRRLLASIGLGRRGRFPKEVSTRAKSIDLLVGFGREVIVAAKTIRVERQDGVESRSNQEQEQKQQHQSKSKSKSNSYSSMEPLDLDRLRITGNRPRIETFEIASEEESRTEQKQTASRSSSSSVELHLRRLGRRLQGRSGRTRKSSKSLQIQVGGLARSSSSSLHLQLTRTNNIAQSDGRILATLPVASPSSKKLSLHSEVVDEQPSSSKLAGSEPQPPTDLPEDLRRERTLEEWVAWEEEERRKNPDASYLPPLSPSSGARPSGGSRHEDIESRPQQTGSAGRELSEERELRERREVEEEYHSTIRQDSAPNFHSSAPPRTRPVMGEEPPAPVAFASLPSRPPPSMGFNAALPPPPLPRGHPPSFAYPPPPLNTYRPSSLPLPPPLPNHRNAPPLPPSSSLPPFPPPPFHPPLPTGLYQPAPSQRNYAAPPQLPHHYPPPFWNGGSQGRWEQGQQARWNDGGRRVEGYEQSWRGGA
ncbi:hypothetical protein BDY24DRAFT_411092 [Mrakia frigida]|uniref:uncharacterized protein n=1 Tax=Mrakia frigida TaxID=29902 RepID=UPI003FCC1D0F